MPLILFTLLLLLFFVYVYWKKLSVPLVYSILIAIVVRYIYVWLGNGVWNFDIDSYKLVGDVILKGYNIYPQMAKLNHPYLPVFLYLEALASFLKQFNIDYVLLLKSVFILFECGIIYLLYILSNRSKFVALLYAVNPISAAVVGFHGQFDTIPLFFILLAIYLLKRHQSLSTLAVSFAVTIKTWPFIFVIPLLKRKINYKDLFLFIALPIFFIILYCYIFKANFKDIVAVVYSYRGIGGNYGISLLLRFMQIGAIGNIIMVLISNILLVVLIIIGIKGKGKTVINEIFNLLLVFLIFTTGFGVQWLMWIIPFMVIKMNVKFLPYIVFSSFYILVTYLKWKYLYINIYPWIDILGVCVWLSIILIVYYKLIKILTKAQIKKLLEFKWRD